MAHSAAWDRPGWAYATGLILGLLSLGFFACSVLRMDYLQSRLLDLPPDSDASEYYAMAQAMAHHRQPGIKISHEWLPSRYPPGYPVLMLPWLKFLPENRQILAPFRTSQSMGLLLLCALWLFYWRRGQLVEAGVAALLLATLPGFVAYCRAPMSEMSGITLVGLAFMAAFQGVDKQERGWIYLCSLLLGLAVNVRMQLILFGPLLLAMALVGDKKKGLRWWLHSAGVLMFFALCASPGFLINTHWFGHPFKTGYDYWVPGITAPGVAFSGHYFWASALSLWREWSQSSTTFSVADLFGTGSHFTPAYIVLALIGCLLWRGRTFIICSGLAWACALGGALFFYYHDLRMFLPIIMLLVPLAVLPVVQAGRAMTQRRYHQAIPVLLLFVLATVGFPSQSGFPKQAWRSQCLDSLSLYPHHVASRAAGYDGACELASRLADKPGVVLSSVNPVFLNSVLPEGFAAAPPDGQHPFRYSSLWKYGADDAARLVRQELAENRPVYALFPAGPEAGEGVSRLPEVAGCRWVPLARGDGQAVILQLLPEEQNHP